MEYKTFEELKQYIIKSERGIEISVVEKAYNLAVEAHAGQLRVSGIPYVSHPIEVAIILIDMGMDTASVCAGLLHDVVEDTDVELTTISSLFSPEIAQLVDGVTKLGKIPLTTKEEQQSENVRKMLLAMAQDVRVIIIKLADRLHNMRTMMYMPENKQLDKSLETMEIYAPIAHRLGIRALKEELEDLALSYLDPIGFKEIQATLQHDEASHTDFINKIQRDLEHRLIEYNIAPHLEGRVKSIYSIYRKVYVAGRSFSEVYDLYAVRVIVSTVIECYNVLGIVHDMFRPIPNRFKDYISSPKPNMYQSLHTTVLGRDGTPFEIQIRTWDMNYTAEYGIAAHWKYKAGIHGHDKLEEDLAWVRKIIEGHKENDVSDDIVRTIKTDLSAEEVYVLTPKGDIKGLPKGSTIVDFAYAIHSGVGNKMVGAKIDSRIVTLDTVLQTGQIVEIVTTKSAGHGPNKEWLKFCKTSDARNKIRTWFKNERRDENILEGKLELEREFKRNNITLVGANLTAFLDKLYRRQRFDNLDDFLAAIGYGGVFLSKIMPRIKEEYQKLISTIEEPIVKIEPKSTNKNSNSSIEVQGIDNCLVKLSHCCNPIPGDEIIGYITRGHGVSIHKRSCPNVVSSLNSDEQRDRFIPARFLNDQINTEYRTALNIIGYDRNGLLADISSVLASFKIPIHELSARELKNGYANMLITIGLQDIELSMVITRLNRIEGIVSVQREGNPE